ncbi:MAG: MerR family transcriptional regulator [Chloroflexi bacterium]|nr:MerR family transcriptional regulator [Chloroflexota bacterium]
MDESRRQAVARKAPSVREDPPERAASGPSQRVPSRSPSGPVPVSPTPSARHAGKSRVPVTVHHQPADIPGGEREEETVQGVYIISVAARLLEMHPQTLRKYERVGLVSPSRSEGMLRLYSDEDIARLRLIKHLVDERRMNLAGVELMLEMLSRLLTMHRQIACPELGAEARDLLEREMQSILEMLHIPSS